MSTIVDWLHELFRWIAEGALNIQATNDVIKALADTVMDNYAAEIRIGHMFRRGGVPRA